LYKDNHNMVTQEVYIVAAKRTALTKAHKGGLSNVRPDDFLSALIKDTVVSNQLVAADIGDVVIGCAFPEAEQGLNIARQAAVMAGLPDSVPGITINRYCSSGLNAIVIAANSIATGCYQVALAGGVESMSMIPMGGNKFSVSNTIFANPQTTTLIHNMGITAEAVANKWKISREDQDAFAITSHQKAALAISNGYFKSQIMDLTIKQNKPDLNTGKIVTTEIIINQDDGIRADTTTEILAKLPSVFANKGCITAGNSSQMTDGAGLVALVTEKYLQQHNMQPLAKILSFAIVGVEPSIMGSGPIKAIPEALSKANLKLADISWIELNEAFAATTLAVIRQLDLDPSIVNIHGGAIALGHPLGATGAVLTTKLIYGLKLIGKRYGIVTMCIGGGMGAAAVIEVL
jgi:acetyl-CoA acyltransferase